MNCRIEWDRSFLADVCTLDFVHHRYKKHRETVLEQRQRALFPSTMPLVENENQQADVQKQLNRLYRLQSELQVKINKGHQRLRQLRNENFGLKNTLTRPRAVAPPQGGVGGGGGGGDPTTEEEEEEEAVHYRRPCVADNCVGYIQSRTGVCAVCQNITCVHCNILKTRSGDIQVNGDKGDNHEHECKKEDVEQWKEIHRSTKPCPGCRTRIFKVSGCDQMWCPQCHTPFKWSTGQVERGTIHNPHYYEWLFSENARNGHGAPRPRMHAGGGMCLEGDDLNRRFPEPWVLKDVLDLYPAIKDFTRPNTNSGTVRKHPRQVIVNHMRNMVHLSEVEIQHLERLYSRRNIAMKNLDIRVRYLRKEIDDKQFKVLLQRAEKASTKARECHQITETYVNMAMDLFQRFCQQEMDPVHLTTFVDNLLEIATIANRGVDLINKNFASRISHFVVGDLVHVPALLQPSLSSSSCNTTV
jgi:hypothetical protein